MIIKSKNVIYTPTQISAEELEIARKAIDENPILTEVLGVLTKQTAKGLAKYPNTVNTDDYTNEEWIDHAIEESIDKVIYLTALKHKLRGEWE